MHKQEKSHWKLEIAFRIPFLFPKWRFARLPSVGTTGNAFPRSTFNRFAGPLTPIRIKVRVKANVGWPRPEMISMLWSVHNPHLLCNITKSIMTFRFGTWPLTARARPFYIACVTFLDIRILSTLSVGPEMEKFWHPEIPVNKSCILLYNVCISIYYNS